MQRKANSSFVPKTNVPAADLVEWAITRPRPMLPDGVTAVLAAMKHVDHQSQLKAAKAIIAGGPGTLIEASRDVDPRSRRWAAVQLGKLPATAEVVQALRVAEKDVDPEVREAATKALHEDSPKKRSV